MSEAARTSYLLFASDNNQNFKIARLTSDYYNVSAQVNVIPGGFLSVPRRDLLLFLQASTLESPGIIKRSGTYHLFVSRASLDIVLLCDPSQSVGQSHHRCATLVGKGALLNLSFIKKKGGRQIRIVCLRRR